MEFPKTYRANLCWAISAGVVIALLAGKGTIARSAIVGLVTLGEIGATWAAWEHKWLRGRLRLILILILVWGGMGGLGWWAWPETHSKSEDGPKEPSLQARIRILDVVPVPMSKSGASFPALNIYYDVVGTTTVNGVVSRFAAGFGGQMLDQAVIAEQDKLLLWDGWSVEMARRKQFEMHPGDPGEFTSIPNMEGALAEQFRANWKKVAAGTTVLHVFITFKFFESSGKIGVSENCFWFSGGFARHNCGRGRTFNEQLQKQLVSQAARSQ